MKPNDLNPTRRSLVSRLRKWDDDKSWQEFFATYWKLIYSVALKAGLTDEEAEDVVQETVLSVAKKMGAFKYDPAVCSFRGWLLHVTRLRIIDQLRKRQPVSQRKPGAERNPGSTATVERVPDPASLTLDSIWNYEWKKNIVDAAMERVKPRVKPNHYQIFYLNAVQKLSVGKVASMTGVSVAQVYLVKHRVAALIRKEVAKLEANRL